MATCIKHDGPDCRAARRGRAFALGLLATFALVPRDAVADDAIKIGILRTSQNGPLFVAIERGYFRAARLDVQFVFFDAAQPVAVATVSGSVDVGAAGTSAGFYNLAGEGVLRVIAGQSREIPGFPNNIVLASKSASAAGLKSLSDLTGHSVAIATIGGPPHYVIGVLAEKHGVDLATLHFLPLQTLPNMVSALIGGQADASVMPVSTALPIIQRDDARQLAIVANEMRSQTGLVFTSTKVADQRRDLIERFLDAYRKGSRDYHAAIADERDAPKDGPDLPVILNILSKYSGQSTAQMKLGIPFADAEGRIDLDDIRHQIAWYRSHNFLKGDVNAEAFVDRRYAIALPGH